MTASGPPGTTALLRALRENGEREVGLVGCDMSARSAASSATRSRPSRRAPIPALRRGCSRSPRASTWAPCSRSRRTISPASRGARAVRRRRSGAACAAARRSPPRAGKLGYPQRPLCFKPVVSSGSRGFRVLLGRKAGARGISDEELAAYAVRVRRGRRALRYFNQVEWDEQG